MDLWQAYAALYSASALLTLAAGIDAWRRRRDTPLGGPVAVMMVALGWWSVCGAAQALLPDGVARELTVFGMAVGTELAVTGFLCGSLALARGDRPLPRLAIALLGVHPAVVTVFTVIEPWRRHLAVVQAGAAEPWLRWRPAPLFWVNAGYGYLLVAVSFVLLLIALRGSGSPLHRRQVGLTLGAGIIQTVGSVLTLSRPGGLVTPDLMPIFALVTGLIYYYAIFRHGVLRLLPVARELVLDTVSDAIFVIDPRGQVIDVNPAGVRLARRLDDHLPASLIGVPARRVLPATRYRRAFIDGEYHVEQPDGVIDLDLRINDLTDRHGRLLGRVVVARDVTELNDQRRRLADVNGRLVEQLYVIDRLRNELAELAVRDELTGLYNRRHLLAQLESDLDRARSDDLPLTVVMLDVDHFKSVNDRFGHAVGDLLLVAVARALAGGVRPGETVARYGGEEFVVVLPGAGLAEGLAGAEMLRRRCSTVLVETTQGPVSTTVSAGVATFPVCGWTSTTLLQSADEALYAAKGSGRDRVVPGRSA